MKLEISSLSFSYGSKEILRNVSFSLESGRSTALLGRNGSGKTTLLRIILGFLKPACGSVSVDGKEVSEMNHRERAKFIAYIPQTLTDIYPYTALETVLMGRASSLSLFQHPGKKDEEKALEALEILGIAHLKNRAVNTLSGGERQRVVMARALSLSPEIILADEPLSALDVSVQAQLIGLIDSIRNKGTSFILVSHDISAIRCISDRIAVMHSGKIVEIGETEAVCSNPSSQYTRRLLEAKNAKGLSYCHG